MKRSLTYAVILSAFSGLSACNHGGESAEISVLPGSGWTVKLMTERGNNKTGNYSGYQFNFNDNGCVAVVKNGQTTTGTWRQYPDDGITKFEIALSTTDNNLSELNDDWVLLSRTNNLISLQDDNTASNEQLQFGR